MRTITPTETQIHKALIEYVATKYPYDAKYLIHIPNEGKRSLAEGSKQKALGLRKGAADLFFAKPSNPYHGLWLELKSGKGKLTAAQKQFLDDMDAVGYLTKVAYSLDDAIDVFETYRNLSNV